MCHGEQQFFAMATNDQNKRNFEVTETILVAEDEEVSRRGLGEVLREEGYKVHEAPDGTAAIKLVNEFDIDLVLTDLKMPGHDGLAVLKRVREVSPETPVIVMSIYGSVLTSAEASRLGAHSYIAKPLIIDELLCKIRHALDNRNLG